MKVEIGNLILEVVESHRADGYERWVMFRDAIRASRSANLGARIRIGFIAAKYSLAFNCQACFYNVERKEDAQK